MSRNATNESRQKLPPNGFSEREERIAAFLASGKSQRQICLEIGVDRNFIRRLLDNAWFRLLVSSLIRCQTITVLGDASEGLSDAMATLRLESTDAEKSADRIRAADLVFSNFLKLRDAIQIDDRLSRLEENAGFNREGEQDAGDVIENGEARTAEETQDNQGNAPLGPGAGGTAGAGVETPGPDTVSE